MKALTDEEKKKALDDFLAKRAKSLFGCDLAIMPSPNPPKPQGNDGLM
jgi:hypothetical protein